MLTKRFERLLRQLVAAFLRYDDSHRTPSGLGDRARARVELDHVRNEIAYERTLIEQRVALDRKPRLTAVDEEDLAVLRVQGMISN